MSVKEIEIQVFPNLENLIETLTKTIVLVPYFLQIELFYFSRNLHNL